MTSPMVSVIVATYNRAPRLMRALDSVAAQTFRNWECLVCDDGSTDGTAAIVSSLAWCDARFRLLPGPHTGRPAGPRNRGVTAARSEWVAFLDDDDLWHPVKLERQLRIADGQICDAVSVRAVPFLDGTVPHLTGSAPIEGSVQPITLRDLLLRRGPQPCTPSTMVKREVVLRVGGFAESAAYRAVEDFDLWSRLLVDESLCWVIDTGGPLAAYRDQGLDSISSWNHVIDPDVIRQRWAQLECVTRVASGALSSLGDEWVAVLGDVIRRADDCAGRCSAVGWRVAASAAYLLAGVGALRLCRTHEAALWLFRAARALIVRRAKTVHQSPDVVPALVRRSLVFGLRLATGICGRTTALPIGMASGWSTVAGIRA